MDVAINCNAHAPRSLTIALTVMTLGCHSDETALGAMLFQI